MGGTRTRVCECPVPANGGDDCTGEATDNNCNPDPCPESGTTVAPDDNSGDDDEQTLFGLDLMMAAAAGGGALLLFVIVLCVCYCYCCKKSHHNKHKNAMDMYSYDHGEFNQGQYASSSRNNPIGKSKPKMPRPPPKKRKKKMQRGSTVKAMHKYKAQRHDEVTLRKGDVLEVYTVQVDGWIYSWNKRSGKKGVFSEEFCVVDLRKNATFSCCCDVCVLEVVVVVAIFI